MVGTILLFSKFHEYCVGLYQHCFWTAITDRLSDHEEKRNIPDKILLAFCVALLICDVIGVTLPLIKASVNRALCKTIALRLHFFSLVLCTWPCIMAFDLWKILRCTNTMERQNFSYLHYSVMAWGIPLIVTLTCLSTDLIKDGTLIRYGNQRYCWIYPFHARLVWCT